MTSRIALQISKDAEKEGIPLVCDVEQDRFHSERLCVLHYDFGGELSLHEARIVRVIVIVAAAKHDCNIRPHIEANYFEAIPAEPQLEVTDKRDLDRVDEIVRKAQAGVDQLNAP